MSRLQAGLLCAFPHRFKISPRPRNLLPGPNSRHPIADFESKAVAGFVVESPLFEDQVRLPNGKFGVDLNGDGIVTKGKEVRVFLFRNNGPEIDLK